MYKWRIIIVCILLGMSFSLLPLGAGEAGKGDSVLDLISKAPPPKGLRLVGAPQTAEGTALFTIINGGAELYMKLGFKRAVFAVYTDINDNVINLEIYEMDDSHAAKEVFAHKTGAKGRRQKFGDEALLEDHFLNFRKGPYQITISGYDTGRAAMDGIKAVAGMVEGCLTRLPSVRPELGKLGRDQGIRKI